MKKIKIILLAMVFTVALAGCGTKNNAAQSSSTNNTGADAYIIKINDSKAALDAFNSKGIIFFYIDGSALGKIALQELQELATEYKVNVYCINVNDSKFKKDSSDANMKQIYAKIDSKAKYLDDKTTLMTPDIYEIENGAIKNHELGLAVDNLNVDKPTDDNIKAIKESYRSLFVSQANNK